MSGHIVSYCAHDLYILCYWHNFCAQFEIRLQLPRNPNVYITKTKDWAKIKQDCGCNISFVVLDRIVSCSQQLRSDYIINLHFGNLDKIKVLKSLKAMFFSMYTVFMFSISNVLIRGKIIKLNFAVWFNKSIIDT